jgi:hypothetical protein
MGELTAYVVVLTPGVTWFSFIPNGSGGFNMVQGIRPAASGAVIPAVNAQILNQNISGSLPRGDYWFASVVFRAGDRPTLADWRSKTVYLSEATVTIR